MGMSNGFWQGLQQGGTVTWLVALVLLVMSVLSWVVIAYKAMGVLQHRRMARQAVQWCHWSAEQRKAWREQTTDLDPYATLTDLGHEAVRELADMVCSTELMVDWCKRQAADTLIITTEAGMIHRLRREVPGKTFIAEIDAALEDLEGAFERLSAQRGEKIGRAHV